MSEHLYRQTLNIDTEYSANWFFPRQKKNQKTMQRATRWSKPTSTSMCYLSCLWQRRWLSTYNKLLRPKKDCCSKKSNLYVNYRTTMHRTLCCMHQPMMHQLLCTICHFCNLDIAMGTTYYGCISSNCRYEILMFQLYMKLYHPFVNPR